MASNLAIDGLISGMKTTDLINSLMQVEAVPQTPIGLLTPRRNSTWAPSS